MSHRSRQAAGFTLVELVVVIVISAIVAVFMVLFLDTPIESYFAQTRRSDLVDSAHRISDAVTADARTALPNSMRVNAAGTALELLATTGVARYYGPRRQERRSGEELTIGSAMTILSSGTLEFGTLDSFNTQSAAVSSASTFPSETSVPRHIRLQQRDGGDDARGHRDHGDRQPERDTAPAIRSGENQVTFERPDDLPGVGGPGYAAVGAQRLPRIGSGELRLQSERGESDDGNPDALLRLYHHIRPAGAARRQRARSSLTMSRRARLRSSPPPRVTRMASSPFSGSLSRAMARPCRYSSRRPRSTASEPARRAAAPVRREDRPASPWSRPSSSSWSSRRSGLSPCRSR